MPKVGSEQYGILEEPISKTSSGTTDQQMILPTDGRATGAWLTVEGVAARVTFGGTTPGVGTAPGIVIPVGTAPLFYPFPFTPGTQTGPKIKFVSNSAGASTMSVIFVQ